MDAWDPVPHRRVPTPFERLAPQSQLHSGTSTCLALHVLLQSGRLLDPLQQTLHENHIHCMTPTMHICIYIYIHACIIVAYMPVSLYLMIG